MPSTEIDVMKLMVHYYIIQYSKHYIICVEVNDKCDFILIKLLEFYILQCLGSVWYHS